MTERVRLLFGSFRAQGAVDAATFTVACATLLLEYPDDIVIDATDPARGVASKVEWLSVKALKDECERLRALRAPEPRPREIETLISDEERARVGERFRELANELGAPPSVISEEQSAAERLEKARGEGWSGLRLSDAALSKLGVQQGREAA